MNCRLLQSFTALHLMLLFFWVMVLTSQSRAYSRGIVVHHFYTSQDTGSPVYLSADLPNMDGLDLEQIPSLQSRLAQLAPSGRLLVVKRAQSYDQSISFQPVGLKLHPKNMLPDRASCVFSSLFPGLLPSSDIDFYGDPIAIHTLQSGINPQCSQVKTADGGAIPFGPVTDYQSYPEDLWLIEIPPLKQTDQKSDTGNPGIPGVSNPTDLRELLSSSYGGGSGPGFDFKPGGGGGSNLVDISLVFSLLPAVREKRDGNGNREGVLVEVTDTRGHQWQHWYTTDEAKQLLEGVEDGEALLSRLQGGNLIVKVGEVEDLSSICRESVRRVVENMRGGIVPQAEPGTQLQSDFDIHHHPDGVAIPPGIISFNGGDKEGNGSKQQPGSGQDSSAQASGTSSTGTTSAGKASAGGATGGGGDERDDEERPKEKIKSQCEASLVMSEISSGDLSQNHYQLIIEGYTEKFELEMVEPDQITDNYKCAICKLICNNSVGNCHIFCKNCVSRLPDPNCPVCRKSLTKTANGPMHRIIQSLEVYCPYRSDGCTKIFSISDATQHIKACGYRCHNQGCTFHGAIVKVEEHHESCEFVIISCSNSEAGCQVKVSKRQLQQHLDSACQHQETTCPNPGCDFRALRAAMGEHEPSCNFKMINCNNLRCRFRARVDEMPAHQQECPYEPLSCAHCQKTELRKNLVAHELLCDKRPEVCPGCSGEMTLSDIQEHLLQCQPLTDKPESGLFVRLLKKQEQKINDVAVDMAIVSQNLQSQWATTYNGNFVWRVPDIFERRKSAINNEIVALYSAPFYSKRYGYRMCLRTYLHGDGVGKGSHVSVYFAIMKGEFDELLTWPFSCRIIIKLLGHQNPYSKTCLPDNSPAFQMPQQEMNIGEDFHAT